MQRDTLSATQAGELLAYGRTAAQATVRLRNCTQSGLITPVGRHPGGRTAAFVYDRAVLAIACVLWWCADNAGVTERQHLIGLSTMLGTARPGADVALIDAVLADVEADRAPVLVITKWVNTQGETGSTFEVRLEGEHDRPIIAPGDDWQPAMDGVLSLAPLLAPFIERTIVPFRKREAS